MRVRGGNKKKLPPAHSSSFFIDETKKTKSRCSQANAKSIFYKRIFFAFKRKGENGRSNFSKGFWLIQAYFLSKESAKQRTTSLFVIKKSVSLCCPPTCPYCHYEMKLLIPPNRETSYWNGPLQNWTVWDAICCLSRIWNDYYCDKWRNNLKKWSKWFIHFNTL